MFVRVLQIVERVRVDLVGGGHLVCLEFHLNSDFMFNKSPNGREEYERDEDARILQLCCSGEP